ncbi:MAG: trypsin-like serine protease [Gammaproteobacteria bacterium]|nr:trypsin-like serine protease [Gammaproteobacteria bacterium]MDH5778774.1 trypsin-like serine protease [Gammaproteobacteria bacterium]
MQNIKTKIIILFSLFLIQILPANAITNGGPDGGAHPYVGLAVMDDVDGNPRWRCSGALIAPRLFLTAGHCTEAPAVRATIWFEEDVDAGIPDNGYPFAGPTSVDGTVYVHPQYNPVLFNHYDLGVIVLDTPVIMDRYGKLPELGMLDPLMTNRGNQDVTFTAVGYGLQKINPVFIKGDRIRLQATLELVDLNGLGGVPAGSSIMLTSNVKTGGICFGDSGGPIFSMNTDIIIAVSSYAMNGNCAGVGGGYRVDTADDLDWLYSEFGYLMAE